MNPPLVDTPELREVPEVGTKSEQAAVAITPAQFFNEKFPGIRDEFGDAILEVIANMVCYGRETLGKTFLLRL